MAGPKYAPPRKPTPTPVPRCKLASAQTRQRRLATTPKRGAGGTGGVPLYPKTSGGWAGGTTAHAKPDHPLIEGARQDKPIVPIAAPPTPPREPPLPPPIAKYERVCYSTPMKSAAGPLLFLGACRIQLALWANHRDSPCGRALREQPKGQDPPRKAGTEANAASTQALWSRSGSSRFRYRS